MSALEFRNLLEAGDIDGLRAHWHAVMPGMPQPESREQAEIAMHMARTAAESVEIEKRAYSHRWLIERDLPSQLPDRLRKSAERMYPVIKTAVGISVNTRNVLLRPAMTSIRTAMEQAVLDAEAEGKIEDAGFVAQRMNEARIKETKVLFGRLYPTLEGVTG